MKRALALCFTLCGCAANAPSLTGLDQVHRACEGGASHAEVTLSGFVVRVLGTREGVSGAHEGFLLATASCSPYRRPCDTATIKIEDNVDLTGPIPLKRGDAVTLRGQYECNDRVIHWTHHDPRGRHIGGFIEVHGQRYQ